MSTNATFSLRHADGTFSSRYHHWDGYVDGLGLVLAEVVNTPQKVEWLFALDRSFSTLFSTIPLPGTWLANDLTMRAYQDKSRALDWPSMFAHPRIEGTYIARLDAGKQLNGCTWAEVVSNSREYDYVFDGSWKLLLSAGSTWETSVATDVLDYVAWKNILTAYAEEHETLEDIAEETDMTVEDVERFVGKWHTSSPLVQDEVCKEFEFDYDASGKEIMNNLDAQRTKRLIEDQLPPTHPVPRVKKI